MTPELHKRLNGLIEDTNCTAEQRLDLLKEEIEKWNHSFSNEKPISIQESIANNSIKYNEGFIDLDKISLTDQLFEKNISSFNKKELIVLAGRPSMGKTQFLVHLTNQMAVQHSVLYHTLDSSISELTHRYLANNTGIATYDLMKNLFDKSQLEIIYQAKDKLKNKKLYFSGITTQTCEELCNYYQNLIQAYSLDVIVIDYIQLLSDKHPKNREQEVSSIMRNLKTLAKEENVCILISSQLSRSVEYRGGEKKPILSDLRESGAIEELADKVMFIYRPEYYQLLVDEEGVSTQNKVEIIVAKNTLFEPRTIQLERDSFFTGFTTLYNKYPNKLTWDFKVEGL